MAQYIDVHRPATATHTSEGRMNQNAPAILAPPNEALLTCYWMRLCDLAHNEIGRHNHKPKLAGADGRFDCGSALAWKCTSRHRGCDRLYWRGSTGWERRAAHQ